MHPEVVRAAPGSCPSCGMGLEREQVSLEPDDNPELDDMTRRLKFALVFAVPLLVVSMGDMLPGAPISSIIGVRARVLLELALATPVVLFSAWPFFVRAVESIRARSPNMFTLIGLGGCRRLPL